MSVWMLVGLFYYLNHYTKRDYFTVWTAAWLFYALWLTLGLRFEVTTPESIVFKLKQICVAISAVFLLWGSLRFLKIPVQQTLFGLFMAFLAAWTFAGSQFIPKSLSPKLRLLDMEMPVFILLGLSSVFAGVCFFRLRKRMPFVGAGMLATGFLLWGLYLSSYPLSQQDEHLSSAGFFVAAVLQLFIAVSMIVLVLEEIRYNNEQTVAEITTVRSENAALQLKMITTEEQCRSLYDKVRVTNGLQQAYDQLRQTQQVVVQQERLRALGQMASGVAHDVNNALSPIVAYADLLLAKLPDLSADSREHLQIIKRSGKDIAQIVARMREFYRRRSESEPLVEVNIKEIIHEVTELTRPRWRDISQRGGISINVVHDVEPNLPPLFSDPGEFREALMNLVFNAVDALPQGGTITLAARVLKPTTSGKNDGPARKLLVEVKDNGTGMDEKVRQRCLEPFFSTKSLHGGTGLGLAMVYGMVQRHEGNIEIDSAPGAGTCIRLIFPVRGQSMPTAPETVLRSATGASLRVLCVDDDELMRQLLSDCLGQYRHQVVTAAGGEEGLEQFRAAALKKQPFDAVITDLGMPQMDGHQFARKIKTQSAHTPIIMLTGWGTIMKEDGETANEVNGVMGKPPQVKELNEMLLRLAAAAENKCTA